jgi:hypothetical protein
LNAHSYLACVAGAAAVQCFVSGEHTDTLGYKVPRGLRYKAAMPIPEHHMSTELLQGSCHCGTVKFEVRTDVLPASRCNCSLCRRKGALMTPPFAAAELKILQGEEALTLYQFNTRTAKHYFCKHCGIYPFHQTRKDPQLWRANIGCLTGIDPYTLEASVANGASLSVVEDA